MSALLPPTPEAETPPKIPREAYDAIWEVVHRAWILLDDSEENKDFGDISVDRDSFDELVKAMEALENLIPEEEGSFWGGYPVRYFLRKFVEGNSDLFD